MYIYNHIHICIYRKREREQKIVREGGREGERERGKEEEREKVPPPSPRRARPGSCHVRSRQLVPKSATYATARPPRGQTALAESCRTTPGFGLRVWDLGFEVWNLGFGV